MPRLKITKNKKIKLNEHLSPFGFIKYVLVINQRQLDFFCDKYKLPMQEFCKREGGYFSHIVGSQGEHYGIIAIRPNVNNPNAVIVHECVHYWQTFRDLINEDKPSAEFEAYFIESSFINIVEDFNCQVLK